MKVYIISSKENIPLATKLLQKVSNANIMLGISSEETNFDTKELVKKSISEANVILTIIDKEISPIIREELQIALTISKKQKKIFLPVLLNDSQIIDELKHIQHLFVKTDSEIDIQRAQIEIAQVLTMLDIKEKKNFSATPSMISMIAMTIAIECFCIFFIVFFYDKTMTVQNDFMGMLRMLFLMMAVVLSMMTLFVSYFSIVKKRHREDAEEEIESYSRRLKTAIISNNESLLKNSNEQHEDKQNLNALGRMLVNLQDIKQFYTWSQKQAKASFVLAVVSCIAGFLLICLSVILPIVCNLQFEIAIIPAIGGALTELIAGTALIVYKSSLKQLNHYHRALHEDERFLSSVNLVEKFSNIEAQDDMLKEIIRSEIQMNISSVLAEFSENKQ